MAEQYDDAYWANYGVAVRDIFSQLSAEWAQRDTLLGDDILGDAANFITNLATQMQNNINQAVPNRDWASIFTTLFIYMRTYMYRHGLNFTTKDDIAQLLELKGRRYGHNALLRWGLLGMLIRVDSKISRAINLHANPHLAEGTDESLRDTLQDVMGYCVLAHLIIRGVIK